MPTVGLTAAVVPGPPSGGRLLLECRSGAGRSMACGSPTAARPCVPQLLDKDETGSELFVCFAPQAMLFF